LTQSSSPSETAGNCIDRIEALDVPVYNVAMRLGIPTPTSCWRLIRLMRRLKPDLIQGWMYHGSLAAQSEARLPVRSVPVVWNIRQSLSGFNYESARLRRSSDSWRTYQEAR